MRNAALITAGIIILLIVMVNLTPFQNFLARQVTRSLADKLNTTVSLKHVRIDLLDHVLIEGLYIQDQQHDTLLYAGTAEVRVTDWFFLRKSAPVLHFVKLSDAYVHLYRKPTSGDWNYAFFIDAFGTAPKKRTKETPTEFELDLKKISLENIRFYFDDAWTGNDMDFVVGKADITADKTDLKNHIAELNSISLEQCAVIVRDYPGGRPPIPKKPRVMDTTAFNNDRWVFKLGKLHLEDCAFSNDIDFDPSTPNEFDPEHIHIRDINLDVAGLSIIGDTIKGKINRLAAKERSGIMIKHMEADVTVSPNASICKNLLLETNNSKIRDYYAMHYERFPDFNHYISSVVMEARLRESYVDSRDIAYFAPVLRRWPTLVKASGSVRGTVDNFTAKNLILVDGNNIVKGDLVMRGLPDINNTFIDYTRGEIFTSGQGIMRYAPELKNNRDIELRNITHAYFKGNFTGYIENFAVNGSLTSNLGTVSTNMKLKMPGLNSNRAVYSGTVATTDFNIGSLLPQTGIGSVSLKSEVSGTAFDPKYAQLEINSTISKFEYRGYPYRNISARGLLEKNKFSGNLLIDDPNLAMAFNGDIDFSQKEIMINAKANLLKSDFAALNLVKDSLKLSGDFDLDITGNNIDNFTGFARLNNINMTRNGHKLDLDSVYIRSTTEADQKLLTIESNALTARIKGNYQLSTLPYSLQYYVSGYLPSYIKTPEKNAPDQNLVFEVATKDVDSMLGIIVPGVRGFNNATVTGSLNTSKQQLTLNTKIPYGAIGNIQMSGVSISGDGNFRVLGLNAEAEKIVVGDSAITGSLSATTTLGNDSLTFNIATTSPDAFGTATLNGRALARGDSLFLTLLPSEFYLNKNKWEIPAGSRIVYANKFLKVDNLNISSGEQVFKVYSQNETTAQSLVIETKNIDFALLGIAEALADYKPSGRINADFRIDNLFRDISLNGKIRARDVVIGGDSLGSISISGNYDTKKGMLTLDGQSGIYSGLSSIEASGHIILFDSISKQKMDGMIQFSNAPLKWLTPLLIDYVSNIEGSLNGNVLIGGTASSPDIEGKLALDHAAVKIDFLGTSYKFPEAIVSVNNSEIKLNNITLYDVHGNQAAAFGRITHDRFKNMQLDLSASSNKFEVIDLNETENEYFYGNLIASFKTLTVRGPLNDIAIRINDAEPADRSHLYLPISDGTGIGSYNYVSFKSYDTTKPVVKKTKNKLNVYIDAKLNTLGEITMVLDPAAGDAINAVGTGNLNLEIPIGNEIRMFGRYNIEKGDYTFTLPKLAFKRRFQLSEGSRISFNGRISETEMNVNGLYATRARLYDLLEPGQKKLLSTFSSSDPEVIVAKATQDVNILLYMKGSLDEPKISFKLDVPDKHGEGTIAYTALNNLNRDDKELFKQVATLLLINSFVPPESSFASEGGITTGAISNVSEMFAGTVSSQVTNIINKLTGNKDLAFDLKYKSYSFSESNSTENAATDRNRNELQIGLRQNLFNDRITLHAGGAYDWGKPSSSGGSGTTSNIAGDFKVEWQLKEGGNLRLNVFRSGNYNVLDDRNIYKTGAGISWRKSFNTFSEFFRSSAAVNREKLEAEKAQ